jgi:hypothetical protein
MTVFAASLTGAAFGQATDSATVVVQSGSPADVASRATQTIVVQPGQTISVQPGQVVVLVVQPTPTTNPPSSSEEGNPSTGGEADRPHSSPFTPYPDRGSLRHFQDEQLVPSER